MERAGQGRITGLGGEVSGHRRRIGGVTGHGRILWHTRLSEGRCGKCGQAVGCEAAFVIRPLVRPPGRCEFRRETRRVFHRHRHGRRRWGSIAHRHRRAVERGQVDRLLERCLDIVGKAGEVVTGAFILDLVLVVLILVEVEGTEVG